MVIDGSHPAAWLAADDEPGTRLSGGTHTSGRISLSFSAIARISAEQYLTKGCGVPKGLDRQDERARSEAREGRRERWGGEEEEEEAARERKADDEGEGQRRERAVTPGRWINGTHRLPHMR